MSEFLRFTVTGITVASIYAIAASGLVVTYTTSGIFNFAHGAFGMMAAFTYWQFNTQWGFGVIPSFIIVVFIVAPLFGAVIERGIMRGLQDASEVVKIVVPVSLMLALIGLANVIWSDPIGRSNRAFFAGESVEIFGVFVTYHRLLILGTAGLVAVLLRFVLYRTRAGISMRAVVDDRPLVQLTGGRPSRSAMYSWAIGAALAAVSGIFISPEVPLEPITMSLLVVNAYAAAVVGKLRSLPMTFVGALILGLTEAYVAGYLTAGKTVGGLELNRIQFAISPALLFIVMVAQPQARLRAGGVQRAKDGWGIPTWKLAGTGAIVLCLGTWMITELVSADTNLIPVIPGFFFAIVALSLVPLTGYAGQISLAQMSFAGIGGVMMAVAGVDNSAWGLLVAVVVSAAVGALIGLPALRLSGIYLALGTAAFALFMTKVVFNQPKIMPSGNRQVPPLQLGPIHIQTNQDQVLLLAVSFALVGLSMVWLRRSSIGRRLTAMKDSPVACATLGLDLTVAKVGVFALSAGIAGFAGALWSRSIQATDFELTGSMSVTMLAVVGGVGAVAGALMGGMLLGTFQSLLTSVFANNAVGLFGFFHLTVADLARITPGFMGISLGRNPNGAVSAIAEAYGDVGKSRASMGITIGVPVLLWGMAKGDLISNWTFTAALLVFLMGVVPLLPVIFEEPRRGNSVAAWAWQAIAMVGVCLFDWGTVIDSAGMRFVAIIAVAILVARIGVAIHGDVPGFEAEPFEQSPDALGVGDAITRSDVLEADVALGVTERALDVDGAGPNGSSSNGSGPDVGDKEHLVVSS
jgi:branched-chain amino acid transport system permease protein